MDRNIVTGEDHHEPTVGLAAALKRKLILGATMDGFGLRIYCVIALLQFVTGCTISTPVVGYDASPQPEVGYLYGRFVQNEVITSILGRLKLGLVLQEQHTNSTYTIEFQPGDVPSVIAVPPGTYALIKLGGKSLRASPLTKPFVVDAGKAYYLADFVVQTSTLGSASGWQVEAIRDNYERTTAELQAKFPRLSLLPTARALALSGAAASSILQRDVTQ